MGISSFSTQYLPRNLRGLGILALSFGILFAWGGIKNSSLTSIIIGIFSFFGGAVYFSLASGISKKEKWASVCGILLMGIVIITVFIQFFLEPQFFYDPISWFGLMTVIVITILLLISFVRSLKEAVVNTISIIPFIITIIGFCLIIANWVFLLIVYLVYQQRQLSTFPEGELSKFTKKDGEFCQITQITNDSAEQSSPAIYEDKIVWSDYRNGNWDIYMYNLTTKQEIQITTNPNAQMDPVIYKDKIVWTEYTKTTGNIYMYDLATGQETQITANSARQSSPAIYKNKIVWEDHRGLDYHVNIYLYDLTTEKARQITANLPAPGVIYDASPAIYEDKIVWSDYRNGKLDIYMYDLATGQETQITNDSAEQSSPAIYEDKIVWTEYAGTISNIYMYDLTAREKKQISTKPGWHPAIYENVIVWIDTSQGLLLGDIYIYDLRSGKERQITNDKSDQGDSAIYKNKIVWRDDSNNKDIYMCDLRIK